MRSKRLTHCEIRFTLPIRPRLVGGSDAQARDASAAASRDRRVIVPRSWPSC
jgi:hypothetical protein